MTSLAGISTAQWLAAGVFSGLSYWALGRYDVIAHRVFRTGISTRRAGRSGMAALAVSQTLGLGIVTGAIARWRLLPDLTPARALALSSFVALSFMAVWAWLALGISALLLQEVGFGAALPFGAGTAFAAITLGVIAVGICPIGWPRMIRVYLRRRHVGLRNLAALAAFACLDMLAASAVFAVLLDTSISLPLTTLVPVFILSLGAGLMSSTPSGLGAFELTMLSLLPEHDPALLLAAIMGYRVVYFTVPAMIGLIALAYPPLLGMQFQTGRGQWEQTAPQSTLPRALDAALFRAPIAEAQLARQPGLSLLWSQTRGCGGVIGVAGHSLVMLRDPFPRTTAADTLSALSELAKNRGLVPCLYKCSARTAVMARQRGYTIMRVAHEAWLHPDAYTPTTRPRRQLRRKLRQAEKAGVRFEMGDISTLPLGQMTQINKAWADAHGGERGFSMGRFHTDMIAHQRVFLAWQDSTLIGFATFHQVETEWTLDLLRPLPETIDGIAHGLIDCALQAAATAKVSRLSLAAAPLDHARSDLPVQSAMGQLQRRLAQHSGGAGLARFKSMFDPQWDPLYIAAPSRWAVLRAGAEIARAISTPQSMTSPTPPRARVESNSRPL